MFGDWLRLHRNITDWEWYKDSDTKSLFIHLLIRANWKPCRFRGFDIKRGQLVAGRKTLSYETGISEQTVRTGLLRLVESKELSIKSTNKFSIITICNYDKYQYIEKDNQPTTNQQLTNNQPTTNQQLTTIEEVKKVRSKEGKNTTRTVERFAPPTIEEINSFFSEKGYPKEAQRFFDYYESNGWMVGKNKMKKWHSAASGWISRTNNTSTIKSTSDAYKGM